MKTLLAMGLMLVSMLAWGMDDDEEQGAGVVTIQFGQEDGDGDMVVNIRAPKGTAVVSSANGHTRIVHVGGERRAAKRVSIPQGGPINGVQLSSHYGVRADPFTGHAAHHDGLDFAAAPGTSVVAVADGKVSRAGYYGGYGNLVEIDHGNDYVTRYGHNSNVKVRVGQQVARGGVIASVGSTGRSTGPHVHYEVLYKGRAVDPAKFVQRRETP